MTAFLPQFDQKPSERELGLSEVREKYQFNYDHVCPLALVDKPPFPDEFSRKWSLDVAKATTDALMNVIELEDDSKFRSTYVDAVRLMTTALSKSQFDPEKFFVEIMRIVVDADDDTRCDSMIDFSKLFRRIGLPPVCRYYHEDRMFVNQRIAGPNPVMLQRMTQPDERFPVSEKHYQAALPNDSLEAAREEGRLYMLDYHMLDGAEPGSFPRRQKYLYAPLALFSVDKSDGQLKPIAIQCQQRPADDNPIFTPRHGWNWRIAKLIVEIADGNFHQTVSHLSRTHLMMEPFAIVTRRQLAECHPLSILLQPHFEGTMNINYLAHSTLIAPGNIVDRLAAGTIESSGKLTVWGLQSQPFNDARLPSILQARGVDDTELLPHYPYRDDSRLYWDAIQQWVSDYLSTYYQSDGDVVGDHELQNWYSELVSQDGGRVAGLGKDGGIVSVAYLSEVVTLIIFTASVQHAAVNFPQVDLMTYVPNMPLAGYAPRPTSTEGATEKDYLDMLPPRDQTIVQITTGQMLGNVHYNHLGKYDQKHFEDERVQPALKAFQREIDSIGATIDERNKNRHAYMYLTPAGVPQSINI